MSRPGSGRAGQPSSPSSITTHATSSPTPAPSAGHRQERHLARHPQRRGASGRHQQVRRIQSSPKAPANAPASTTSATVTSTAKNAATARPGPHGIGPGGSGASAGRGGASTRIDSTSPETGSTNSTSLPGRPPPAARAVGRGGARGPARARLPERHTVSATAPTRAVRRAGRRSGGRRRCRVPAAQHAPPGAARSQRTDRVTSWKATAAAVATLRESTPAAIGMRTRRSAAASASGVSPGPSAPSSRAARPGETGPGQRQRIDRGVSAATRSPAARRTSSDPGHSPGRSRTAPAARAPSTPARCAGRAGRRSAAEQHPVDPERGRVAEQRPQVLVVVDALRDGQQPRVGGEGARIGRRGPVGDGEHAAVEVEADDRGHRVGGDGIGGTSRSARSASSSASRRGTPGATGRGTVNRSIGGRPRRLRRSPARARPAGPGGGRRW